MQISVTFRHMDASDALKDQATERVAKLTKYFDSTADAHVVFSAEKYLHVAEVNIAFHGMMMRGKETSGDMYNSLLRAIDKIETQVKRYRNRIATLRPKTGAKMKMHFKLLEGSDADLETASDIPPTIIETKEFQALPMMLDEAVMQMDLLHNDILVFINAKTDHVNVLYRKKGNKYGLIETNNS
jgi:putative sigma-54 modulation protein